MEEHGSIELGPVQKTLLLPLWGRAVESKRPNPLLVDRKALEIVERMGLDLAQMARRMNELSRRAWVARALTVDRVVGELLERRPEAVIANIGCGLDTTFERVDNGRLRWYDVDLPDVAALRRRFIEESPRRELIAASFLDEGWLEEVAGCELFVAAGLFYYFEERTVRSFFARLADRFPGAELLFDVCSPRGMRTANRAVISNAGLDERSYLKWGLERTEDLLSWDERYRILEVVSYFKGAKLPGSLRLLGWLSDRLKIQYMVRLKLG